MTDIKEVTAELIALREEAQKKAGKFAKKVFAKIFSDNPGYDRLVWTQYTPYFNDGDACTFGISDMYLYEPDEEVENWPDSDTYLEWNSPEQQFFEEPAVQKWLEEEFGDHSVVIVHSNGEVDVRGHDHD